MHRMNSTVQEPTVQEEFVPPNLFGELVPLVHLWIEQGWMYMDSVKN